MSLTLRGEAFEIGMVSPNIYAGIEYGVPGSPRS